MLGAGFKADVPTEPLLALLLGAPLPLGLTQDRLERALFRDLYLDTPDRALRARGVLCRFRYRADDRRVLSLAIGPAGGPLASGAVASFEAEVGEVAVEEALAGTSAPARRLRGIVEPSLLEVAAELELDRMVRTAHTGWLRRARFEFVYDRATVRVSPLARGFQELKVRRRSAGRPTLDQIAAALETAHGLRPVRITKMERAAAVADAMRTEIRLRGLGTGGSVAVVAVDRERLALLREGDRYRLPVAHGSGEAASRHALHEAVGSRVGDTVLLGTLADAAPSGGSLEVWLVRRIRLAAADPPDTRLVWLPADAVRALVAEGRMEDAPSVEAMRLALDSASLGAGAGAGSPPAAALGGIRPARRAARRAPRVEPLSPGEGLDADLSQIAFNLRVLGLAEAASVPLLERLRYLAIVSANLDELYMVSGESRLRVAAGPVRALLDRQRRALDAGLAALAEAGIGIRRWAELSDGAREALRGRFRRELLPLLTPRAITVSPGHPFPVIPALALSFAVVLADEETGPVHVAYLRVPPAAPRFLPVPGGRDLLPIEEVIRASLDLLYPDRSVEAAALFRVTRAADLLVQEAQSGNLLQAIEEELDRRPLYPVVRVELERSAPAMLRDLLLRELRFEGRGRPGLAPGVDVQEIDGLLGLGDLRQLGDLPVPGGRFAPFAGGDPLPEATSLWERLRARDLLVHHPYDDFGATVLRFVSDAAGDPDVVAIKMTLYRAGDRSALVEALARAAAAGKDVAAFVELKARQDEARNVAWVKRLERAGVQVIYGLVGLKTHAKVALVVRREGKSVQRYVHVGSGNYNTATARLYTDLGLLTADEAIGDDATDLFNALTGATSAPAGPFRRLLVAPSHLLRELLARIERETEHAHAGRPARIRAKLNGVEDAEVVRALYRASQAGVEIDLIVRGLCTLRPGVPGLSERIRVRSILGRFLEHGRIYHFANGGDDEYFVGSADWRPRNLRRRVEVVAPVSDPEATARLDRVLTLELADPSAWVLGPDGGYSREPGAAGPSVQERLVQERSAAAAETRA